MAGWATKIDKTLTSFEETTGKIQDAAKVFEQII